MPLEHFEPMVREVFAQATYREPALSSASQAGLVNNLNDGLAWGLCSTVGARDESSACRMLSAEQWARLDPANAVPWMSVMDQARARGDSAAADEALYRVSQARTVNAGTGRFAALLLDRLPASVGPLEAMELAAETFSIELQAPAGWYGSLRQACSAPAQRDGNRQQQCQAIAEGLWRFGSSPLELAVAVQIGAASGWPADLTELPGVGPHRPTHGQRRPPPRPRCAGARRRSGGDAGPAGPANPRRCSDPGGTVARRSGRAARPRASGRRHGRSARSRGGRHG